MISSSAEYKEAIVAKSRRTRIKAVVDITDPDMVMGAVTCPSQAPWSKKVELTDKDIRGAKVYTTLERGRWPLNRNSRFFPTSYSVKKQQGYASAALCNEYGVFPSTQKFRVEFSNCHVLQAVMIYGSEFAPDGFPEDFSIKVYSGNTAYAEKSVTGNHNRKILVMGFTVYYPTAIEVTITRWSLPWRRARVIEIVPGIYEEWDERDLAGLSVTQQANFSCITLPYGTAKLTINNLSRRFDPRNKMGVFQSIVEGQGIDIYIGVDIPPDDDEDEDDIEFKRLGIFYQNKNGWKTSDNDLTIVWDLVDIIGLMASRAFLVPDPMPDTLEGWVSAVTAQMGARFKDKYKIDPDYKDLPAVAYSTSDVENATCGDILRWACMVTGTWPRADAVTAKIAVEPLWNQGNTLLLRNLAKYPHMEANESIAALIYQFKESAGSDETKIHSVSGNATTSEKTITVRNPFVHSVDQAITVSRLILSCYGGNVYRTTGRGDPASEIGDVDTIWLDESNAATARRMAQTLKYERGVLMNCTSKLLQADGSYLWTDYVIIRKSGTWTVPARVEQVRIVLGSGGQGGGYGADGTLYLARFPLRVVAEYGEEGTAGKGGKIWYGVVGVNPGQTMTIQLGAGGAAASYYGEEGGLGGDTTFGLYSSANGTYYENGYTDIANGQVFARTGVEVPLPGTGDGGKGGPGGEPGVGRLYQNGGDIGYRFERIQEPGPGGPGADGATGFCMISWERPS